MARNATAEIEETQTDSETGQSKRQRVDVNALAQSNPHEKLIVALPVPAEMRVLIRQQAESQGISEVQYIRDTVAGSLGYTVPASFNERKRRTSAMTEEERKAHAKAVANERREQVNRMLAAIQSGAIDTAQLEALGIDLTKLPKPRKAGDDEDES